MKKLYYIKFLVLKKKLIIQNDFNNKIKKCIDNVNNNIKFGSSMLLYSHTLYIKHFSKYPYYIFKFYKCNGKVFQGTFYLNSKLYGFPS